jgi:hypothetical protein
VFKKGIGTIRLKMHQVVEITNPVDHKPSVFYALNILNDS